MTLARRRALLFVAVLMVAGAVLTATFRSRSTPQPAKPTLLLLTSLPLLFGEDFDPRLQGSPALDALSRRFTVRPISTTAGGELAKGRLLLMAQPPAEAPEDLVSLDAWVRRGGRALLLADPMLEWPSDRPLGDPLRPPIMFTDTGLLSHWGLRLDAPEQRGSVRRMLAREKVAPVSPGSLHGGCRIAADRFVAICDVGRGRAIVVADADLLNVPAGSPELEALLKLLAWLSSNDSQRTDLSTGVQSRTD